MNDNKDPIFYRTQVVILIIMYVVALRLVGFFEIVSRGTL
tara:strand:- start:34 stop:153 length:120 start_codon:yes stop_codon:yes gene_type:complete